ncbi:MAG: hypothetical protein Q9221_006352 [Calogaya cf. arnoldii]
MSNSHQEEIRTDDVAGSTETPLPDTSNNTVSPGQDPLEAVTNATAEVSDADSCNLSEPPASSSADTVVIAEANAAAEVSDAGSSDLSEPPASSSADTVDIAEADADANGHSMVPANSLSANAVGKSEANVDSSGLAMSPANSSSANAVGKGNVSAQPSVGFPSSGPRGANSPGRLPLSEVAYIIDLQFSPPRLWKKEQAEGVMLGHAVVILPRVTEASKIPGPKECSIPARRDAPEDVQPGPRSLNVVTLATRPVKGKRVVRATDGEPEGNTDVDIAQARGLQSRSKG